MTLDISEASHARVAAAAAAVGVAADVLRIDIANHTRGGYRAEASSSISPLFSPILRLIVSAPF